MRRAAAPAQAFCQLLLQPNLGSRKPKRRATPRPPVPWNTKREEDPSSEPPASKPGDLGQTSPLAAHLKTDRAIMVGVKSIEEKSSICTGVCRLLQTLGPVTHGGQFKLILHAVCRALTPETSLPVPWTRTEDIKARREDVWLTL